MKSKIRKLAKVGVVIQAAILLSSCSIFHGGKDKVVETKPEILYEEGDAALRAGDYEKARKFFEQLELEHPASSIAGEAQIRRAFAYYEDGQYDDAIAVIEMFLSQYPAHKDVAYMYYMRGMCYYEQIVDVERDQALTWKAIAAFNELLNRFPNSKYAEDAKFKTEFAYNSIAGQEMAIGRFYLKNNQLIAALNRFKAVIEKYQTTMFAPEALYRIVEVYYAMGVEDEALKYAAVLGHNFPNNEWYKKAYNLIESKENSSSKGHVRKFFSKIW